MDPTACLNEIRELVRTIADGDPRPASQARRELHIMRLAELVDSLDQWIAKGGFLPVQWQR